METLRGFVRLRERGQRVRECRIKVGEKETDEEKYYRSIERVVSTGYHHVRSSAQAGVIHTHVTRMARG